MFKINFQKINIYSFFLAFSLSMLTGMDGPREISGDGANQQGYLAYFLNQFRFPSLPSLRGLQSNPVPPIVVNGVLTIALEHIDETLALNYVGEQSLLLANLLHENPEIRAIHVINPNARSVSRNQLDFLGMYFHHIETLHLIGIDFSEEVLISLNQFSNLRELNFIRCNISTETKRKLRKYLHFPKLESFKNI